MFADERAEHQPARAIAGGNPQPRRFIGQRADDGHAVRAGGAKAGATTQGVGIRQGRFWQQFCQLAQVFFVVLRAHAGVSVVGVKGGTKAKHPFHRRRGIAAAAHHHLRRVRRLFAERYLPARGAHGQRGSLRKVRRIRAAGKHQMRRAGNFVAFGILHPPLPVGKRTAGNVAAKMRADLLRPGGKLRGAQFVRTHPTGARKMPAAPRHRLPRQFRCRFARNEAGDFFGQRQPLHNPLHPFFLLGIARQMQRAAARMTHGRAARGQCCQMRPGVEGTGAGELA